MGDETRKTCSCLQYSWNHDGLTVSLSWIYNNLLLRNKKGIKFKQRKMPKNFNSMEEGDMNEYVGCTIWCYWAERPLKMMQPVLIQSLRQLIVPGLILMKCDPQSKLMS